MVVGASYRIVPLHRVFFLRWRCFARVDAAGRRVFVGGAHSAVGYDKHLAAWFTLRADDLIFLEVALGYGWGEGEG